MVLIRCCSSLVPSVSLLILLQLPLLVVVLILLVRLVVFFFCERGDILDPFRLFVSRGDVAFRGPPTEAVSRSIGVLPSVKFSADSTEGEGDVSEHGV